MQHCNCCDLNVCCEIIFNYPFNYLIIILTPKHIHIYIYMCVDCISPLPATLIASNIHTYTHTGAHSCQTKFVKSRVIGRHSVTFAFCFGIQHCFYFVILLDLANWQLEWHIDWPHDFRVPICTMKFVCLSLVRVL